MKIRVAFVAELAVNFVLPWVVYRLALPSWGESGALYASAVPPLLWGIVEFARTRRVDALSAIALLGIALSIALMAGGGSPRLLLGASPSCRARSAWCSWCRWCSSGRSPTT